MADDRLIQRYEEELRNGTSWRRRAARITSVAGSGSSKIGESGALANHRRMPLGRRRRDSVTRGFCQL
jgi:hypothetical protein